MKKVPFLFILAVVFGLLAAGTVSAQTTRYVNFDGVCGGELLCYTTIQAAIDAAGPYDTIFVAAGTYNENLVIANSQIYLIGAGTGTTIIQNSGGIVHVNIKGSSTNVELTGFTIRHTGETDWGDSYAILVEDGAYANIHDNILDDYKKRGIYVMGSDSSADITGNTLIGGGYPLQNGIVIWESDGGFANIAYNEVSGMSYGGDTWAASGIMALSTYDKKVTIEGNYVHDNNNGVGIAAGDYCGWPNVGSYSADITIRNNRVVDNSWGLEVINDARGVLIEGNDIVNSTYDGIDVYNYVYSGWSGCGEPTSTVIRYNNIVGSGEYGIWAWKFVNLLVDAKNNWWGHPSGPYDPLDTDGLGQLNLDGEGDPVTEYVLYDPWVGHGGFVTGGGTIWSEKGDCVGNPEVEGVANFGFVAQYKKGANVPEGNTNFVFSAGELHFQSSEYDWLVVAGEMMAQFKGKGTIEGESGVYKFKLWARDDDPDTFRIKIWGEIDDDEFVVYDNGGDPLTGGNIFIHKEKKKQKKLII